ncbi:MAG: hypothetical protein AAB733_02190 [Patescibacteria group bacterium]
MLKSYTQYIKSNPQEYWFKAKLYGWGWTPAKWQGWLISLVFVVLLVWNGIVLGEAPTDSELRWYFVKTVAAIVILLLICWKKGEKPRWQWGPPRKGK